MTKPPEQFPKVTNYYARGIGALQPYIDPYSLQELRGGEGQPVVAFTSDRRRSPANRPQAVREQDFGPSGWVEAQSMNVKFLVPRGLYRLKSLVGDKPQRFNPKETEDRELAVGPSGNYAAVELVLAVQLSDLKHPQPPGNGDVPFAPDKNFWIAGDEVIEAAFCTSPTRPCRLVMMASKESVGLDATAADASDNEYVSFEFHWKKYYAQAMGDFAREHQLPDIVYLIPTLISDRVNDSIPPEQVNYQVVWSLLKARAERMAMHTLIARSRNDFHAGEFATVRVPIPGVDIRMDTTLLVACTK